MYSEIEEEVRRFNNNSDSVMEIKDYGVCCELFINGESITEDYHYSVYQRIRDINRENGYHYC